MKCRTKRCRGVATKAGHSPFCPTCRRERFKEKHPLAYSWGNLKRRARQRGVPFSLTLEEYKHFAIGTDYAAMKGKTSLSLSIDRIENGLGYHAWNIQAITLRENSRKQWVPYHNHGCPPEHLPEYHRLEREYRGKMERIASRISNHHAPGTKEFWKQFNAAKEELIPV